MIKLKYTIKAGKKEGERMNLTPMKAIRAKCLDCSGGNPNEVKLCPVEKCSLYPFRLGKNPYSKRREYTEEEKEKFSEYLKKAREAKNNT